MQDNIMRKRLRELRAESGLSQAKLGKELGLSAATIGYYENGDRLPDIEKAARIATYFHVSVDYLLGLSDCKKNDDDMQAACKATGLPDEIIESLHYLSGIPWAKEMVSDTINAIMGGVASQKLEEHFQKGQTEYAE